MSDFDDEDVFAAEYALRLLEGEAEQTADDKLRKDPVFAQRVAYWNDRLSRVADEVAPVAPPPALKTRITKQLFGPSEAVSLWNRLGLWRGLTFASLALCAVLLFDASQKAPVTPEGQGGEYLAEVISDDATVRVLVHYDPATQELGIVVSSGQPTSDRSLQLWGIGDNAAPVSIGVLDSGTTSKFILPNAFIDNPARVTLAVSDEPLGGSPTDQPTGAVVAVGQPVVF